MSRLSLRDAFRLLLIGLILVAIASVSWAAIGAEDVHPLAINILAVLLLTSIRSREAVSYVRFQWGRTKKPIFWDSSAGTIGAIMIVVTLSLLLQYVKSNTSLEPVVMFGVIAGIFIIFVITTSVIDIIDATKGPKDSS